MHYEIEKKNRNELQNKTGKLNFFYIFTQRFNVFYAIKSGHQNLLNIKMCVESTFMYHIICVITFNAKYGATSDT